MSPHTLHRSTIPPVSIREAYNHNQREKYNDKLLAGKRRGEREGGRCVCVLTGERASETTRSFGHCGMVVGCRWYRRYLGNWSIVYFRKLEDHFWGRSSSPLFPSLPQGPNLLKGDTLWGRGLRVGGGRLGLVSTWRTARTWAGTARRASVQDNTTWRNREKQKLISLIFIWVSIHMHSVGGSVSVEQHSTLFQCAYLAGLRKHTQNLDRVGTTEIWSDK